MQLTVIGSVGMGLMWGWLLILIGAHMRRPLVTIPVLILATVLVVLQQFFFSAWPTPLYFLISAVLALIVHASWRQQLHKNL